MMRFVCMRQCSALRAKYMRKHPQVYADAINRHRSQPSPVVTADDVLRLAAREDAAAAPLANHKAPPPSLPFPPRALTREAR